MSKHAIIKRTGFNSADIQIIGSTGTINNVPVSSQISWDMIEPGKKVLIDFVEEQPIILHTLESNPNYYSPQPESYVTVIENALLSDGSIPLQGNLSVLPGITIDGYDISVLGQAIGNLQAADTIARTGWTVFSHSTHLVSEMLANDTTIVVRDSIFSINEQAALSNTDGEIEFIRITSLPTQVLDDQGAVCYTYTVTRRIQTSPSNLNIGWAAATLINGLTNQGYISIDNRHRNSTNAPNITASQWLDNPPTETERVFRLGNLKGVLGITDSDFGAAFGRLDSRDAYMLINASKETVELRNSNYVITDTAGNARVKIYGKNENDRLAGDYTFGIESGVHTSFIGETETWGVYNNADPIIEVNRDGGFIRDLLTVGNFSGARVQIGEIDNQAAIVARDKFGVAKFVVQTSDSENIYFSAGNPEPQHNRMSFSGITGRLHVDGSVDMDEATIYGSLRIANEGYLEFIDTDDPLRKGVINRRGIVGYSVDSLGQQFPSVALAWAPLVVNNRTGQTTLLAGEFRAGDFDYRHFRVERGSTGRAGLFNGETPIAYIGADGVGYFDGIIYARGGEFTGNVEITTGSLQTSNVTIDQNGIILDALVARYNAQSLKWSYGGIDYLYLGTNVDEGIITKSVIGSSNQLRLEAVTGININPGSGDVTIGGVFTDEIVITGNTITLAGNGSWQPYNDNAEAFKLKSAAGTTLFSLNTTSGVLQLHDTSGTKYLEIRGPANTSLGIGLNALASQTGTNKNNVAVGKDSSKSQTTGYNNTSIGTFSLYSADTGHSNVAVGYQALYVCSSGAFNMAVGRQALYSLTTGQWNSGIGYQTAYYTTSGNNNLAMGASALQRNTTGSYNIALGNSSAIYQANGSTVLAHPENSIYIGAFSRGFNDDDNNSIVLGYSAIGEGANTTVIGSTPTQSIALFGAGRFDLNDTVTDTAPALLTLRHNSSGTPTNNFGSRVLFELKSNTTTNQMAAAIDVAWTNATHGSRSSGITVQPVASGNLVNALFIGPTELVINDAQTNYDFRVEGDTSGYVLFVDASADAVGIGTQTPETRLHVRVTDAATTSITNLLKIEHNTTNTPSAGYGAAIVFSLENTGFTGQQAARVAATWYDADAESYKSDLIGYASDLYAEREIWRGRATGSAPAIGFLNATPAERRSHVANPSGGTTVDVEARAAIDSILTTLETFGFHATS